MKRLYVFLLTVAFAAIALTGTSFAAEAKNPEEVFIFNGEDWVLHSGAETEGERGAVVAAEGVWWYAVNPETEAAAKGLERGILLYDANAESGKAYTFLPTTEEQARVELVMFSPDKKRMVVRCNLNRFASGLYVYVVATLELENSFWNRGDIWFVSNVRFVFTLVDTKVKRPETAAMWATSAAIYEIADKKGYVVLKGASATESFTVTGVDQDQNLVNILVTSVKSAKDWEDIEKQQESETTVEVPAAG